MAVKRGVKQVLKLPLLLPDDSIKLLSLSDPAEGLSKDECEGVMSSIISTQAFKYDGQFPSSWDDAYIEETSIIDVPA